MNSTSCGFHADDKKDELEYVCFLFADVHSQHEEQQGGFMASISQ